MSEYIEKIRRRIPSFPKREEGQSREEYLRKMLLLTVKGGACTLAAAALIGLAVDLLSQNVSVSNSVNGKELPVYCVETSEKKIALTFDAAWGKC